MVSRRMVKTVMIINREDNYEHLIIGTELYVGDNTIPYLNTDCNANP